MSVRTREKPGVLCESESSDSLLPELIELIGGVKSATAPELATMLKNEKNIKASTKAVEKALESGCKLNIVQECRHFTVNKDFYVCEERGMDSDDNS